MTDPLISVIIPTVRRPLRLWRALASVAAQTYPNVEVVVVNDGGVPIAESVARYAAEFGRPIRAVTLMPGRGVAAARNAGIRVAEGDLIAPLDDDDRFRPDHLARLAPVLVGDATVALAYDDIQIQIESGAEGDRDPIIIGTCRLGRSYDAAIFAQDDFIPPSVQLLRHSDCDALGGFDETLALCEDWDFLLRLRERGAFQYVPGAVGTDYSFRLNAGDNLGSQFDAVRDATLLLLAERYHLPPLQPKTFLDVAKTLGFPITWYAQPEA